MWQIRALLFTLYALFVYTTHRFDYMFLLFAIVLKKIFVVLMIL